MISIYEELIDEVIETLIGTPMEPKNLALIPVQVDKLAQFRGLHTQMDPKKKSRVTVAFYMHRFGTQQEPTEADVSRQSQDSDIFFVASISSRELYGEVGMYKLIELVTGFLIGRQFRMQPISAFSTELLTFDEKQNSWNYQVTFRVRDIEIQGFDDAFDEGYAPFLTRVDIDDNPCAPDIVDNDNLNFDIEGYTLTTDT